LIIAARRNNLVTVKLLLEKGADPNIQDSIGSTALISAVSNGNYDMVKMLIDNGADVNLKTVGNVDALIAIMLRGGFIKIDIVRLLLENGADPNGTDRDGRTMMSYAYQYNRSDIAKLLEKYGGVLNL